MPVDAKKSIAIGQFSHIQLNVSDLNVSKNFYLQAFEPIGFLEADSEAGEYVRLTNGKNVVIVLCPTEPKYKNLRYHRKGTGLGHFALAVSSNAVVDEMEKHLFALKIPILGEGKIELGYRRGYYCMLFEDPDRIMVEIEYWWCGRGDSNSHTLRYWLLRPACLPISPRPHEAGTFT